MASVNTAQAHWEGSLMEGSGRVELVTSGVASFDVAWAARAESGPGTTNPEELIAAAVEKGDFAPFHEMLAVVTHPFDEQPGMERYAEPPAPEQRVLQTFCGT